jgi:uncharacterized membrane protein YdbT with pleckstrin-like domain
MIDLQGDEKIVLQMHKSWAVLVPRFFMWVAIGAAVYFVSCGFYAFRDKFLFTEVFKSPQGWFANGVHQNILILGGLAFLLAQAFMIFRVIKTRNYGKQGTQEKSREREKEEEKSVEEDYKALVRKSVRRLTSYYRVERMIVAALIIILTALGLFAMEAASPWYYVVIVAAPLGTYLFLQWFMTRYALTTKRLTISAGFVTHFFWDLPFDKYDEISGQQNFIERIFRYGDLTVNSVGGSREVIKNVPRPDEMRKNFHAMREEYKQALMGRAMERAQETREEATKEGEAAKKGESAKGGETAREGEAKPVKEPQDDMP